MNKERRARLDVIIKTVEAIEFETLEDATAELELIRDEEQEYFDKMPENMKSGDRGINAEHAISQMDEAITLLQDISEDDARAEGVITEDWDEWRDDACSIGLPAGSSIENERDVFRDLWKSIHGPDAWEEGMNDPEVYLDHVGFYDPHLFRTAFNGPTKWCVLLPKLTDEDYGEVLCCDTLEEAEAACEERRKALGEKQ